jgi:hypothetical protein
MAYENLIRQKARNEKLTKEAEVDLFKKQIKFKNLIIKEV